MLLYQTGANLHYGPFKNYYFTGAYTGKKLRVTIQQALTKEGRPAYVNVLFLENLDDQAVRGVGYPYNLRPVSYVTGSYSWPKMFQWEIRPGRSVLLVGKYCRYNNPEECQNPVYSITYTVSIAD